VLPKLAVTREGSTDLLVPAESLRTTAPETFPAFFNPAARLNRDVSVVIARATKPSSFLDALAGIGARGVRVANEASKSLIVTLVEFNQVSIQIAKRSAKRNGIGARCEFVHQESNAYLHSRFGRLERFEAVDLDPFGTPAPYVQGTLNAAEDGALVSITATDTATLCGVYPSVALRRYGARVTRCEFAHEAAVRILVGFVARVGGTIDTGIEPVAAHSTLHYLRVYLRVLRGASNSDRCLKELGYVTSCMSCRENSVTLGPVASCPRCGARAKSTGPLWVGMLVDEEVRAKAVKECSRLGFPSAEKMLASLKGCNGFPPFGFSLERITSREKLSSVRFQKVVESLRASGRSAMRQPFGSSGLKTVASYQEVLAAVRESAR